MERLNFDEHFAWKEDSPFKKPWNRYNLNTDFLKNEQARIEAASEWFRDLVKSNNSENVPEVVLYVQRTRAPPQGWAKPISEQGNYEFRILSVLRNANQVTIPALFPSSDVPEDYRLIRLEKATKTFISNKKSDKSAYFVEVEEYSRLRPDERYLIVDVDHEKRHMSKILKRKLGYGDKTAASIETPLVSSPNGFGAGGVGLTSLDKDTESMNVMFRHLETAIPPEYRTRKPPKSVENGKLISYRGWDKQQLKFRVAEQFVGSNSVVSTGIDSNFGIVNRENDRRYDYGGEYSFLTSLDSKHEGRDLLNQLRNKFTQTESKVLDPTRSGELKHQIDTLGDEITQHEDLHIEFAFQRQIQPSLEKINQEKWKSRFQDNWEAFAPELGIEYDTSFFAKGHAQNSLENRINQAQALARRDGREVVKEKDVKRAFRMFKNEIDALANKKLTKKAKKQKREIRKERQYDFIQEAISGAGLAKEDLWMLVKSEGVFGDKGEFEDIVERLRRKGLIYKKNGRLRWYTS